MNRSMKLIRVLGVLVAFSTQAAAPAEARGTMSSVLEDDCLIYLSVPKPKAALAALQTLAPHQLWSDPQVQQFLKSAAGMTFDDELPIGLLAGLNDRNNNTQALGIVEDLDFESENLTVRTPLEDHRSVRILHFGSIRLDPSGRELPSPFKNGGLGRKD